MPYFDSDSDCLREPLVPYIPSIDLILRSIHTMLKLESNNTSSLPSFNHALFRQRLFSDGQCLEDLIEHLATPLSGVINFYQGVVFIHDLERIKGALATLLLGAENVGTQYRMDLVRYTKQQIEVMLGIGEERMVF
ncbi:hypothetical protein E2P81_ATG02188 [Venturia nashicola]|uniref:Uncharacterized protein n=1 Tax=Venturia nashicola TaxID=86259 RepID=A0A4Z1P8C9_9PEZI|nr:hypothetical protein E6O75_ATG02243 [Venturia nashicola]TLD35885.1 hypothetical protein E2P81_ATG02188 [Venturia nashicola]